MKGIPKKLKIIILAEDFKTSNYCDLKDCPVARACVRDLWIDPSMVCVGGYDVDIEPDLHYLMTDKQSQMVADMFRGLEPKDFTMILTLNP